MELMSNLTYVLVYVKGKTPILWSKNLTSVTTVETFTPVSTLNLFHKPSIEEEARSFKERPCNTVPSIYSSQPAPRGHVTLINGDCALGEEIAKPFGCGGRGPEL